MMHPAEEQRQSQNAETEDNDAGRFLDALNICADDAANVINGGEDEVPEHLREEIRHQGHKGRGEQGTDPVNFCL